MWSPPNVYVVLGFEVEATLEVALVKNVYLFWAINFSLYH